MKTKILIIELTILLLLATIIMTLHNCANLYNKNELKNGFRPTTINKKIS
jgi:hypothetical protein